MNEDRYRPDFQTDFQLPPWLDMGEPQTPDVSPFVGALKKRMAMKPAAPMGGAGGMMGAELGGGSMGALGKAASGGPKSL